MRDNEHIRYEPDEKSPVSVTLGAALQGSVLALSNTATLVTTFVVAFGGSTDYLTWAIFASLTIAGIITVIQATKLGRLSPGYLLLTGPGVPFMAVCVLAVDEGGLPVMSSLIVAASFVQFALAFWLAQLRRIITPVVAGVAFMVIAVSAMPIAIARWDDVPAAGGSPIAGPVVGAVALFTVTVLMLRASGLLRLLAIPVTIVLGSAVAIPLGVYDAQQALDAPWLDLPQFSAWPGLSLALDQDFLALLVVFLIVSMVVGIRASNEGSVIQQVSWRKPRAVDFRSVQGTVNAGGIGVLLSGIAGILPVIYYLPSTMSLISFTGIATRRTAYTIGAMLIGLALLPKLVAVLLTIPKPVTGAILMIIMGLLHRGHPCGPAGRP